MRGIHLVRTRIAGLTLSCLALAACDARVRGDSAATGAMPPMGGARLSDAQVHAVAAYVFALSRAGS